MRKLILALLFILFLITIKISPANAQSCTTTPPTNTGKINLTATISSAGDYRVWSRIKIPDTTNNSFYLQIDGGCAILVGGSTSIPVNSWTWIDYQNGSSSNKITANLTTGDHVLTIIGNGTGVGVDKLLLTQNLLCVPTGFGDNCPALTPTSTPTPTIPATSTPTPPTATNPPTSPTSTNTVLRFPSVKIHGIGKGGDNSNPNANGAQSPKQTTRTISVILEDTNGNTLSPSQGNITYNPTTGDFSGEVILPDTVTSGNYLVFVKNPQTLRKRLSRIISIQKGTINQLPNVALTTGDINNDNLLTITDYNILMDCYSDFLPAKNCDAIKKVASDIWDDGNVDQKDYNIFIKELSTIPGE